MVTLLQRDLLTHLRTTAPSAATARRVVVASMLATAGLVAASLLFWPTTFEDLDVYRIGVQTWLSGGNMYGPLPPPRTGLPLPFIYPPFAALALSPFALVPWIVSWVSMAALSMACLVASLYVTARRVWTAGGRCGAVIVTAIAVPLSLLLDPVAQTFWFGQVNLLLMALVVLDCLLPATRWPRGMLIGIAAAIKLTPAAFILFFLFRRDYRAAGTTIVTFCLAALVGFAVAPDSSWTYWTGSAQGVSGLAGSPFASNQAIMGALSRLHQLSPDTQKILWFALCLLALALAAAAMRRAFAAGRPGLALASNAALGLLVSPISWGHHWVYVAPALLAVFGQAVHTRNRAWASAAAASAVIFVLHPYHFLPANDFHEYDWAWWQHLVGNSYGLLAFGLLAALALRKLASGPDATAGQAAREPARSPSG